MSIKNDLLKYLATILFLSYTIIPLYKNPQLRLKNISNTNINIVIASASNIGIEFI